MKSEYILYAGDDAELILTVYNNEAIQPLVGHTIILRLGHWPTGPTILEKSPDTNKSEFADGVAVFVLAEEDTADLDGPHVFQVVDRDELERETVVASGRITFLAKLGVMG
jgi:hypothetical protein